MSDFVPVQRLIERLADARGGRVVFVSHCLLNENTRYLGGAGCRGCVPDLVERCLRDGLGIVQMPCPEERAWGGVLKRHFLRVYGEAPAGRVRLAVIGALAHAGLAYTRRVYRRLARQVADQIADYVRSGYEVAGVIGVDGSPSCGVATTLDPACVRELAAVGGAAITVARQDAILRAHLRPGAGMFVAELQRQLRRRGLAVPLSAHDLFGELTAAARTRGTAGSPASSR